MSFLAQLLGERRSAENPARPLTDTTLLDILGGPRSVTGRVVSPSRALQLMAVYACVRIISEDFATLPAITYRRLARGKERATNHSLYPVLHDVANPEMTTVELREAMQGHVLTWGNAYSEVVRNGAGAVKQLWPLRPDKTKPVRNARNELVYEVTLPDSEIRHLRADRVLHIRGLSFDGLVGYSPIGQAREALGMAMAAEEYGARFYANDSRPGGVLQVDKALQKESAQRLKASWQGAHSGLSNAHRVAVLEEGIKWQQIGLAPKDTQFMEARKFQTVEIARLYRMPLHKIGELDRATWGNIEHQAIEYLTDTLDPWLVRWEKRISRTLLTEDERKSYFVEFMREGKLRGDISARYAAYQIGKDGGWLSPNEIREFENMNPREGGDEYADVNPAPPPAPAPPVTDDDDDDDA